MKVSFTGELGDSSASLSQAELERLLTDDSRVLRGEWLKETEEGLRGESSRIVALSSAVVVSFHVREVRTLVSSRSFLSRGDDNVSLGPTDSSRDDDADTSLP